MELKAAPWSRLFALQGAVPVAVRVPDDRIDKSRESTWH